MNRRRFIPEQLIYVTQKLRVQDFPIPVRKGKNKPGFKSKRRFGRGYLRNQLRKFW